MESAEHYADNHSAEHLSNNHFAKHLADDHLSYNRFADDDFAKHFSDVHRIHRVDHTFRGATVADNGEINGQSSSSHHYNTLTANSGSGRKHNNTRNHSLRDHTRDHTTDDHSVGGTDHTK
jgi:hypothetical protein